MKRKNEKPTSPWRALLTLILAIIMPACSTHGHSSYGEAYEAYETATTPEAKRAALESIERFEQLHERAEKYFQIRKACFYSSTDNYIWVCKGPERYDPDNPPKGTDEVISVYKRDKYNCGCTDKTALLRSL